ncbi:glutamate-5-semialdehyde dehydrogenase [Haematospirillum jordaniae]|nr:glutamate-5-semialdehyde dehydrogenase [Haematospirillum jordaniae]NKD84199.1 glutamate-5-semialdehyde dehydrogenase [Haematospirillum jordaniae]NKD92389.1 glutamate-5-semialdehyde dehydrogenase [Haematospirillum jordaniae]
MTWSLTRYGGHKVNATNSLSLDDIGQKARQAQSVLAIAPGAARNLALTEAAQALRIDQNLILDANAHDRSAAQAAGITPSMLDRLSLDAHRIEAMARSLEDIASLPDPLGTVLASWERPNGLRISRVRVPLGVIGVIYESRPNVTADAGGLCLKSGNAVILRGGSESFHSSQAILGSLHTGLKKAGLPEECLQMIQTTDRAAVGTLLRMDRYVDVIIPRGGRSLIERITAESRIPVLKHLDGICHTYLHAAADPDMAVSVVLNAKMRRTGICGATETLLVDRAVAPALLPCVAAALAERGCVLKGDPDACTLVPSMQPAHDDDWDTEYLDAILSIRIVEGPDEAIQHIQHHSSHHTDAIITEDAGVAERFLNTVDSAIVMWNASTQFADGGEFGMGAEIGIATGKLHARGPVGTEQLTTFKYHVRGNGQCRA